MQHTSQITETHYVRVPEPVPSFMGLGGWICLVALAVVGCGHLFNWLGRTRYALSWHDVREVKAIERLRNGVYGQIPWHSPHARVNQLPALEQIGQPFDLNRVAVLAEQSTAMSDGGMSAHTTGASVAPTLQPIEPVADSVAGDGLTTEETQQINRLVFATHASLNQVAKVMRASKNSKRYHAVRDQWRIATDRREAQAKTLKQS